MRRRHINLQVSDHAVLRYLERRHGIDVDAVRRHLAGLATNAAELGAVAVRADQVRLFLREAAASEGRLQVTVTTVRTPGARRGLGAPAPEIGDG